MTGGAQNCNSFNDMAYCGNLPPLDSLTYQGIFNSSYFIIQQKSNINDKNTLSLELANFSFKNPITNENEKFISCLIKSKYDGIGARKPIDCVFVLDKSGSMSSCLGTSKESCISLAKNAMFKLIDSLEDNDRISFIAIDTYAHRIFPLETKKELQKNNDVTQKINSIAANGGTQLAKGYKEAYNVFTEDRKGIEGEEKQQTTKYDYSQREKRIIFTTDMNYLDDRVFEGMIVDASKENIFTTVLGIGVNLDSNFLERVSKVKGFNYFSATNKEQLNDIIIENFKYNYFPIAHDMNLMIKGEDIEIIEAYGSDFKPENKSNNKLNPSTVSQGITSIVKINSFFPSPLVLKPSTTKDNDNDDNTELFMKGGLILIKYKLKESIGKTTKDSKENSPSGANKVTILNNYIEHYLNPNYKFGENLDKNDILNQVVDEYSLDVTDSLEYETSKSQKDTLARYLYVSYLRELISVKNTQFEIVKQIISKNNNTKDTEKSQTDATDFKGENQNKNFELFQKTEFLLREDLKEKVCDVITKNILEKKEALEFSGLIKKIYNVVIEKKDDKDEEKK